MAAMMLKNKLELYSNLSQTMTRVKFLSVWPFLYCTRVTIARRQ